MRAIQLVRYNWPSYSAAAVILIVCGIFIHSVLLSPVVRLILSITIAGIFWFAAASFFAFYWMFDQSVFSTWRWLLQDFRQAPGRWVLISAGLEETTGELEKNIFPDTNGKIVKVFQAKSMNAPALKRARIEQETDQSESSVPPDALPVEDAWADAVIVALVAHEIRERALRTKFFLELKRILSHKGKLILVEHLRNLPAFLAFGPGAFHFLPYGEWRALARETGFMMQSERSITPFIRIFVLIGETGATL